MLEKLGQLLSKHASTSPWYFEYFFVATKDVLSDELYVGEPSDLSTANEQTSSVAGPTYWWPADRAWCVCTDYDLPFTVVASMRAACEDIAGAEDFEGFEMASSDRVDYESYTQHD